MEQGIKKVELCIHPNEKQLLPLDAIFKTVHATQLVPFIKYNPGTRRENIYRIFSTQINKYGNKVPILKRTKIIQLSKDIGKNKQISFYVPYFDGATIVDIILVLSHNSNMYIDVVFEKAKTVDEINRILRENVNPIIQNMNVFLNQNGYQLNLFENLHSDFIEVTNMKYVSRVQMKRKISNFNEGYILAVFDVIEENVHNGAVLKYKRVENYEEMNAEDSFILNWFNSTVEKGKLNREEIIGALMDFLDINRDQALLKIDAFLRDHTILNGSSSNILENSGFLTKFSTRLEDDSLYVEMENINSILYIDIVGKYLDSIIRIKQYPGTITIDKSRITSASKPIKDVHLIDKPHVENIVVPVFEKSKVMPLRFGKIQEDENYEDENYEDESGIIFEEYEDDDQNNDEYPNNATNYIAQMDEYPNGSAEYKIINDEDIIPEVSNEAGKDIDYDTSDSQEGIIFDYDDDDDHDENGDNPNTNTHSGGGGKKKEKIATDKENKDKVNTPDLEVDTEAYEKELDGMVLRDKNNNIFLKRLKQKEPTLYLSTDQGKQYKRYSRLCQSSRQPVIITNEEKRIIDLNHSGSYSHALEYGTDPNKKNWYICPKYWCLKTNTSITEDQVKSGMCGKIIPENADTVPPGHYVYKFGDTFDSPGFLTKDNLHPDGYCLPCCFKEWGKKQQKEMRNKCIKGKPEREKATGKNVTILKIETVPIEQNRMGFLPLNVQRFLQINNGDAVDPQAPSILKPDGETFLRYGVEQDMNKSFIGCIADLYSKKKTISPTVSIARMSEIIKEAMTLDIFIKAHNGILPSVFKPSNQKIAFDEIEYDNEIKETSFFKSINLSNDSQREFLSETILAYQQFLEFLLSQNMLVDYTYLWDIVCSPNPKLFEVGLNLAILDVTENDSTDNIELVCPVSAYSKVYYDPKKETLILLKNGEIFEPIYLCSLQSITPTFFEYNVSESLKQVLQIIRNTTQNYCTPLSSIRTYEFKRNQLAEDVRLNILKYKYKILFQVQNFQGKIIGFYVKGPKSNIFVPCLPSAFLKDIPIRFIDDDNLWSDYISTRDVLKRIHKETDGNLLTNPVIKVIEDGLIVGILTETNQFIEINPPSENIHDDDLREMKGTNYIFADKEISRGKQDPVRVTMIKRISLESQFYSVFRSFIRILLNDYENRDIKKRIVEYISNPRYNTRFRLKKVEKWIRELSREFIEFHEYSDEVLDSFHEISNCQNEGDSLKKYCLTRDETRVLLIPKKHLFSGANNDIIYYARISDEIVRYRRIQSFLLQPNMVLNISHTDYKINKNEMILLESLLTKDYFSDLVPLSQQIGNTSVNITYDKAHPRMTQKYSNRIDYTSQLRIIDKDREGDNEFDIMCVKETSEVIGNPNKNLWKKMFPKTCQEVFFNESRECSFYPILYILKKIHNTDFSVYHVKETLRNIYSEYLSNEILFQKIITILRKQGKKEFMEMVKTKRSTFEEIIISEGYYLTNLDLWMLADKLKLPIVLFSSNKLKNLLDSLTWIIMGGKATEDYYFVRAYTEPLSSDKFNDYHLIVPALKFSELRGFQNIVDMGFSGHVEYSKNTQTLKTFLENYQIVKK
jgi:hypothetical protein